MTKAMAMRLSPLIATALAIVAIPALTAIAAARNVQ